MNSTNQVREREREREGEGEGEGDGDMLDVICFYHERFSIEVSNSLNVLFKSHLFSSYC